MTTATRAFGQLPHFDDETEIAYLERIAINGFERDREYSLAFRRSQIRGWKSHLYLEVYRRTKNFTQSETAKMMGVSLRAYCYYESGDRAIPHTALQSLATYTDVDLNFLLTGNPSIGAHLSNATEQILTNMYRKSVEVEINRQIRFYADVLIANKLNAAQPINDKLALKTVEQIWLRLLPEEKRMDIAKHLYRLSFGIDNSGASVLDSNVVDLVYYTMEEIWSDFNSNNMQYCGTSDHSTTVGAICTDE